MDEIKSELIAMILAVLVLVGLVILFKGCGYEEEKDEYAFEYDAYLEFAETHVDDEQIEIPESTHAESEYDRIKNLIKAKADEKGVDAILAIAIWRLETGNGTSKAFLELYNFGGLMGKKGLIRYADEDTGCTAFIDCLKRYQGKTVEEMEKSYCPDGSGWAKKVRELMSEEDEMYLS